MTKEDNTNFYAFSYTPETTRKVVILLHGYGANCDDMAGLVDYFVPHFSDVAFYCLDAPEAVPFYEEGRQWFPMDDVFPLLSSMDKDSSFAICRSMVNKAEKARLFVEDAVAKIMELHHLAKSDIVLGGFSQGGAVALYTGLLSEDSYAGLLGLSTLANCADKEEIKSYPPVLLTHGTEDETLPFISFETTFNRLKGLGIPIQGLAVEGMGHAINPEVITAVQKFLEDIFSSDRNN